MKSFTEITRLYRMTTGTAAWLVHRVSGILMAGYLALHVIVLNTIRDREAFEGFLRLTHSLPVRIFEFALLGVVAAHALGGIRVMIMEAGAPTKMHKPLFYLGVVAWMLLMALAAGPMLMGGGS